MKEHEPKASIPFPFREHEPEAGIPFPFRPRLDRQGRLEVAQVVAVFRKLCPEGKLRYSIAEAAKQCGVPVHRARAAWSEFENVAVASVEREFRRASEKRGKGRPKGTNKLPGDYLLHLLELCRRRPAGISLSQWCREIVGSAKLSNANFEVIPIAKSWRSLRSRLVEAEKIRRETGYKGVPFNNAPRGPHISYALEGPIDSAPKRREAAIWHAIGQAGTTALHVPQPKARRKRVAELSKLFAGSETKLHK